MIILIFNVGAGAVLARQLLETVVSADRTALERALKTHRTIGAACAHIANGHRPG